jgi:hypothetical protein
LLLHLFQTGISGIAENLSISFRALYHGRPRLARVSREGFVSVGPGLKNIPRQPGPGKNRQNPGSFFIEAANQ